MGRMVKCYVTGNKIDSKNAYKIGSKWFTDKETYIHYLQAKDISYQNVLSLLTEDRDCIISDQAKSKIIKIIIDDLK